MPKVVLSKMLGINASKAKLQLQPGESDGLQNIRCRPFDNWVKRKGIEAISSQSDPINGIFEIELDNITIPLIQSGDTLTFFPDLSSANGTLSDLSSDSAVFGSSDPLDPLGRRTVLFLVEQTMRAIQDRRVTAGHTTFSWPNLIFAADGTQLNGNTGIAVSPYPANNLYGPDLTYHDIFYGNPAGTRAAALVNSIISCCIGVVNLNDYVNPDLIEGQTGVTLYTTSIFPAAASATRSNYRQKLNDCKTGIRKLTTIGRTPTQVSVESKTGTASDDVGDCTDFGLITLINAERVDRGLSPLTIDARLNAACQFHVDDMVTNDFFSHIGSGGDTIGSRITAAGYPWAAAGENMDCGHTNATDVYNAWFANTGQKAIMLNATFTDVGLACASSTTASSCSGSGVAYFWTANFAHT